MKTFGFFLIMAAFAPITANAQGLREVPQRFAYIEPMGLLFGFPSVGYERVIGRRVTVNVAGIGVYTKRDGILVYGGGAGIGIRGYVGEGEAAGLSFGTRVDGLWLHGDNRNATNQFLGAFLAEEKSHPYLGVNLFSGYRVVTTSGWFFEPNVSYEFLFGPAPLVAGSRELQRTLGISAGVMFGLAW